MDQLIHTHAYINITKHQRSDQVEKKSATENEQKQEAHRVIKDFAGRRTTLKDVCGSVMLGKASDQLLNSCFKTEQQVQSARGKVILKRH